MAELNCQAAVPKGGTLANDPRRVAEHGVDNSEQPEKPPPAVDSQITNQLKSTRPSLPQPASVGNVGGAWTKTNGE